MSRSKKRNIDELEHLRSENKELRSMIKSLERQIKKLNREYHPEYEQETLIKEDLKPERKQEKPKCQKCGKGNVELAELGPRTLEVCSNGCGYRKKIK